MSEALTPALSACGVSFSYNPGNPAVVRQVSCRVMPREILGIIGPNGSGKSTLLRLMSGYLEPSEGYVDLFGRDIRRTHRRQIARQMAVVAQSTDVTAPFTVHELVQMAKYPWKEPLSAGDEEAILNRLNLSQYSDRPVTELSGGERQRALLAQALAQRPRVLLLDEPTSHLDLRHQVELLDYLSRLRQEKGTTVVAVLHDLNLAAAYCDRLLLLAGGRIVQDGSPATVLTERNIASVFGVEAVVTVAAGGTPRVIILPAWVKRTPSDQALSVHVVGGGGSAATLLQDLVGQGYRVTLAPVNAGDADQRMADRLEIPHHSAPPFSPLDDECRRAQRQSVLRSDWVVLCSVPFGSGNIGNLEELADALRESPRPLIMVEGSEPRDFTGGAAGRLLEELRSKARVIAHNDWEVADALRTLGSP